MVILISHRWSWFFGDFRMLNGVFTATLSKRSMCCSNSVCPSVRLSVSVCHRRIFVSIEPYVLGLSNFVSCVIYYFLRLYSNLTTVQGHLE